MNTRTYRPIPLGLTMLIALFGAWRPLPSGGHDAAAHGDEPRNRGDDLEEGARAPSGHAQALGRPHHVDAAGGDQPDHGSPDTEATVGRLLAEPDRHRQRDQAVLRHRGAGKQLTALLREHILIAADLIAAAKAGDQAAVASEQARWTANADEIARFLSKRNPRYWKLGAMKEMMHAPPRLTTDEVVARLQRNWAADVQAYDRIHGQILHMADMLSTGHRQAVPGALPLAETSRIAPEQSVSSGGRWRR